MNRIVHFLLAGMLFSAVTANARVTVTNLKCEYLHDPLGIDIPDPRFFWQLESAGAGKAQTAWRIIVSNSQENLEKELGDSWDSGKVRSNQNIQVVYAGKPLLPARDYFWKVMIWDQDGRTSGWSPVARFGTGLFQPGDWKGAQWIAWRLQDEWEKEWWRKKDIEMQCLEFGLPSWFGQRFTLWELYHFHHDKPYDPAPLFRKEFRTGKMVRKAKVFISGLGYYELFINGKRVGDQVLNPGWTNYKKTVLYDVHEVTDLVQMGENAIGAMLGRGNFGCMAVDHWDFYKKDGFIGQPKMICRLQLEFDDGTIRDIVSDTSWMVTGGPMIFDDPRMGEIYDARKEIREWNEPGKPTGNWDPVRYAPAPVGTLKAQLCEPIRVVDTFHPVMMEKRDAGWWIDAGTNMSGWISVQLNGPAGEKVLIFYGEEPVVKTLDQPSQFQQMAYILKGGGQETAECRFAYKGFRYALITGYSGTLSPEHVTICQVNSDVEPVGEFTCSDTTINGIHRISRKALISNLHSIPTDCPHREKNGWLGDAVTGMEFGMANYDLAALMTKFTRDVFDTQDGEGRLSIIAPDNNYCTGLSPLWASAAVHIPWYMYVYYGDTRLFRQYWDPITHWVQSVWKYNQIPEMPGIFNDVLSDWCSPYGFNAQEGGEVYSSMNFYLVLKRLETIALVLGKEMDAHAFAQQAEIVKTAVNTFCFDSRDSVYHGLKPTGYRQGPNTMALQYGLVPEPYRQKVISSLVESLVIAHAYHVYGGVFTVHALYELLPSLNRSDLAMTLARQDSWPGFGFMLKNGATTLWESWNDDVSHIHHFFGSVDNFFYRYLAGINISDKSPGFRRIRISPHFVTELDHASATYQSIQGHIRSAWKKSGNAGYSLEITIPANCVADLDIPVNAATIFLNGKQLAVKSAVITIPSGTSQLEITLKK